MRLCAEHFETTDLNNKKVFLEISARNFSKRSIVMEHLVDSHYTSRYFAVFRTASGFVKTKKIVTESSNIFRLHLSVRPCQQPMFIGCVSVYVMCLQLWYFIREIGKTVKTTYKGRDGFGREGSWAEAGWQLWPQCACCVSLRAM